MEIEPVIPYDKNRDHYDALEVGNAIQNQALRTEKLQLRLCEDGGRAEKAAGFFKRKEELVGKTNSIWIIYPIIKYE